MAKSKYETSQSDVDDLSSAGSSTALMAKSTFGTSVADEDDLGSTTSGQTRATATPKPRAMSQTTTNVGRFTTGEVAGDESVITVGTEGSSEAGAHEEVGNASGTESGQEFVEATPQQLASAETGEESALSDLRAIEGFEDSESAADYEAGEETTPAVLAEAGEAIEGGQEEFFPFLAALAPMLLSKIGPTVAKGVMTKLSGRAKRNVRRVASKGSGMLSMVAKLLESGQEAAEESGAEAAGEVDQATIDRTAGVLEVIIGTDDRVRITKTTIVPWRRICALRIQFPSGSTYRGTGFFIGPRAVATAGHCVYLHNQGGWARSIEVIPGCNGSSRPFGQARSSSFRSVGGWVSGKKPESDYGCVILPAGAFTANLGSFGFAAFDNRTLLAMPAVLAGYPGDKPFAEMWGMSRRIKAVTAKTLIYDIDTVGGQSGAPVYIKRNGQRYVVGVHNYGASAGNSATRITQAVYERLLAWSRIS